MDFLPKKPLKEQEMVLNNYSVWVISGVMAKSTVLLQILLTVIDLLCTNAWKVGHLGKMFSNLTFVSFDFFSAKDALINYVGGLSCHM